MTPAEIIARADRARDILSDPMVVDALAIIERDVMEAFYACPVRDLEGMRILQTDLRLARQFKGILQGAMERGKLAAHELREKESLAKNVVQGVRRMF